ncbi:hypothetical protein G7Z17_g1370 [Cylindrodendrum hubeiense]|uniref:Uncharacterized protein n=1 Tax=Cylindrodendrum hubeiense TaxID=595255 RepID=A0A9P5HQA2_9HYPO|nr:hypothetical protein G7Z17_g1370 [Cylindrodendrum hubeiense]
MLGYGISEALEAEPWAIDQFDEEGYTPFQLAAQHNRVECLKQLITAQADINQKDWGGRTALMLTAYWGRSVCMQVLLRANCRVDQEDDCGMTALYYAMWGGSGVAVALLLAAGASPTKRQKWNQTPLQFLARSKVDQETADDIVRLLLVKRVDLCALADMGGVTPALDALYYTNMPVLRSLVEAGASLHAVDHSSQNMLHRAARFCNLDTLRYLNTLNCTGINTELYDSSGKRPWDYLCNLMYVPDLELVDYERRPNFEEQDAFVALYNDLLLQNLQYEIDTLEQILGATVQHDKSASSTNLETLMRQKEDWKESNLAAWYRGINGLVRGGCWEQATIDLEDTLEELKSEKQSLPRKPGLIGDIL